MVAVVYNDQYIRGGMAVESRKGKNVTYIAARFSRVIFIIYFLFCFLLQPAHVITAIQYFLYYVKCAAESQYNNRE